jgi:hypothetical protein
MINPNDEEAGPARPIRDQTVTYIWQGSDSVQFDPLTSTNDSTTARVQRIGEAKVWAQIQRGGRTITESTMQTFNVELPSLSLQLDPPGGAMAGQDITTRVVISPSLNADLFSLRWLEPPTSNRLELDATGATIHFTGEAGTPVILNAQVVTAYFLRSFRNAVTRGTLS